MGANGSYDKNLGGVPKDKRTHTETGYTVMGHKVLLQKGNESQTKNILNANMGRKPVSNGENPHLPIPIEFSTLNSAIETFNKQKHKLKKK